MTTANLISVSEAARRLGISVSRVRQLCESGELPAARTFEGWRLFNEEAVEALARRRTERRQRQRAKATEERGDAITAR